jgi:hypothetical protein
MKIDYDNDSPETIALKHVVNYCEDAGLSPVYPKAILAIIKQDITETVQRRKVCGKENMREEKIPDKVCSGTSYKESGYELAQASAEILQMQETC